jgi:hypothetical protein
VKDRGQKEEGKRKKAQLGRTFETCCFDFGRIYCSIDIVSKGFVRWLWLIGTSVITVSVVYYVLQYHMYSEYMQWNISNGPTGK